jgi:hypothetical protein
VPDLPFEDVLLRHLEECARQRSLGESFVLQELKQVCAQMAKGASDRTDERLQALELRLARMDSKLDQLLERP